MAYQSSVSIACLIVFLYSHSLITLTFPKSLTGAAEKDLAMVDLTTEVMGDLIAALIILTMWLQT